MHSTGVLSNTLSRTCINPQCGKVFMARKDTTTNTWSHTCSAECREIIQKSNDPVYNINWDNNPDLQHDERGLPMAEKE